MKKAIGLMGVLVCFLMHGCQTTVALKDKPVAEPIIADFQVEQAGEDLRIRFSFQNLAGGIGKAIRTNQLTLESWDGISVLTTYDNFGPQTLLKEAFCDTKDLCEGGAEFILKLSEDAKGKNMRIGYAMMLSDTLGRKTKMVKSYITYNKTTKL